MGKEFIHQYLTVYRNLQVACEDIYEPVKDKYVNICTDAYYSFNKVLDEQRVKEELYLEQANTVCDRVVAKFVVSETSKAEDSKEYGLLLRTNDEIIEARVDLTLQWVKNDLQKSICYSQIQGVVKGHALTFMVTGATSDCNIENYDLTSSMWASFTDRIKDLSRGLIPVWTDVKKRLLEGKHFDIKYPQMMHLILKNPEIKFASNNIVEECFLQKDSSSVSYFTTIETYKKTYKPVIREVIDALASKGYCESTYAITYNIDSTLTKNAVSWKISSSDKYSKNFEEILFRKLKKIYCKKHVEGEEFTELLEVSELV